MIPIIGQAITLCIIIALVLRMYLILKMHDFSTPESDNLNRCKNCDFLKEVENLKRSSNEFLTVATHKESDFAVRRWAADQFISKEKYENDLRLRQASIGYLTDQAKGENWIRRREITTSDKKTRDPRSTAVNKDARRSGVQ